MTKISREMGKGGEEGWRPEWWDDRERQELPLLRSVSLALDAIVGPRDHPLHWLHHDHPLHLGSKCIALQPQRWDGIEGSALHPRIDSIELDLNIAR